MSEVIIDAANTSLGRLASTAAKQALLGKKVVVVNCDKAIITGNRRSVINEWYHAARRGGASLRGPFVPRKNTERIVKRTIRGMLSYKQQRGLDAFKRIMCYADVPQQYANENKLTLVRPIKTQSITLKELSREL